MVKKISLKDFPYSSTKSWRSLASRPNDVSGKIEEKWASDILNCFKYVVFNFHFSIIGKTYIKIPWISKSWPREPITQKNSSARKKNLKQTIYPPFLGRGLYSAVDYQGPNILVHQVTILINEIFKLILWEGRSHETWFDHWAKTVLELANWRLNVRWTVIPP